VADSLGPRAAGHLQGEADRPTDTRRRKTSSSKRNPLFAASDADLRAQFALAIKIRDKVSEANNAVITIRDLKAQVADRLGKSQDPKLKGAGDKLVADLSAVEVEIYQVKNQAGQDPLNFPIKLNNRLSSLTHRRSWIRATDARSANAPAIFNDLSGELKVQTDRLARAIAAGVPERQCASESGWPGSDRREVGTDHVA